MARRRVGALFAVLVGGWLMSGLVLAGPVMAESPYRLEAQVSDSAGVLTPEQESQTQASFDAAREPGGDQAWVSFVDSFDGVPGTDWADATATASGLGGNDALLAVATGDREYGYSLSATSDITDAQMQEIMGSLVEPKLANSDWAGAAQAFAQGIAQVESGGSTPPVTPNTGSAAQSSVGSGALPWVIGGLVIVVAGLGLIAWRASKARSGPAAGTSARETALPELRAQAAAALIEVDDSMKSSTAEFGFAVAQFGDEAGEPFKAALAASDTELKQAFALQQKLDDSTPDTDQATRAMLTQIIDLCRAADERLDAQVESFDKARDMAKRIDKVIPDMSAKVEALRSRHEASAAELTTLGSRFSARALATYADSLKAAGDRITFAADALVKATAALSGDRSAAVNDVQAAELAMGQAGDLLDTVDRAPADMEKARSSVLTVIAETQRDIAEAAEYSDAGLPTVVDQAKQALSEAQSGLASGDADLLAALRSVQAADGALETVLGPLRDAAAAKSRAEAMLASAANSASASIAAADGFITTRRGAVGAQARTRLAEAQRRLSQGQSLAQSDPTAGLAEFQAADQLADQAMTAAQQDEASYSRQTQRAGMGPVGSAVLGGILINAVTDRRQARGGAYASGRTRSASPSPASPRPAGFGGGAARGRRGGGGRF